MRLIWLVMSLVGLGVSIADAPAQSLGELSPGFSLGIAYAPDGDFTRVGWHLAASLERLLGKTCELRGRLGALRLEADIQGEHPDATYTFLTADVVAADLVSPSAGIGLYHVSLAAPITDDDQRSFEFGVNAGVRFLIPYHHDRGISIDAIFHRVFGDGPSVLFTFGAGLVF